MTAIILYTEIWHSYSFISLFDFHVDQYLFNNIYKFLFFHFLLIIAIFILKIKLFIQDSYKYS